MPISAQPSEDFLITQRLRNDWTRPIQYAPNCMSWKDSHPSKKQKQIMHDNDSYMRSKTEMRKYDPSFHNKKYGKSGAGGKSSFNEVQKKCLWDVRDKAFHGKSFEKVQAEKVHIIDQNEYNNMHDAHKNPQAGYKPTKKLSKDNRDELNHKCAVQKGTSKAEGIRNIKKYPEVCHKHAEGNCGNCDGSYMKQLGCIFIDMPNYKPKCLANLPHEAK